MSRRRRPSVPPAPEPSRPQPRVRTSALALLFVAVVLLLTLDDRHVGRTADERQVIWAAVAMVETGQLAQAAGHDFAYVRPDGQAVSRYGIGMTLLQLPAAWLAPMVEARLGGGSSQPLFLIAPFLLVLAAAWGAGRAARALGGGEAAAVVAVVLTGLGSPLGSYAAMAFSEPLQAAALSIGFAAALRAAASEEDQAACRAAFVAGLAAGVGLVAKSLLVAVMPFALLPLLGRWKRTGAIAPLAFAVAGAAPGAALWAWFEWVRFGRFLASYPGEGFTHPFVEGLWRLVISPNAGFIWFFPAVVVAAAAWARTVRHRDWRMAVDLVGGLLPFIVLLAVTASWWAWHGVWGWGPRLLVPAVPPLAAVAASSLSRWRRGPVTVALVFSVLLNLPGLLQHPVPVLSYVSNLTWPTASPEFAQSVAGYARQRDPDGTWRVGPDHVLSKVPQASPFIVYPWFWWAASGGDLARTAERLASPPWIGARPDLSPAVRPMTPAWLETVIGPPRAKFWGRGFRASPSAAQYAAVYDEALADQVLRLLQQRKGSEALALATKLVRLAPDGRHESLVLECYRVMGDRSAAASYLSGLSVERRSHREINVVLALFERDAGNEELARAFLKASAESYANDAPIHRALEAPLSEWPPTLERMIQQRVLGAGE